MGRKTFESILGSLGKPLPGRTSIVITRNADYASCLGAGVRESLVTVDSPEAAVAAAAATSSETFVIGGAEIYRAMLPLADRLIVTEIHQAFDGDAFFPAIDPKLWREAARRPQPPNGTPEVSFDFVEYTKHGEA
jgi:dihydrofolate reductase